MENAILFRYFKIYTIIGKVMVQITTEELKELLEIAFDKGWMGYCDLKEAVVQELLSKYKEKKEPLAYTSPSLFVNGQGWVGTSNWSTLDMWTANDINIPQPPEDSN